MGVNCDPTSTVAGALIVRTYACNDNVLECGLWCTLWIIVV